MTHCLSPLGFDPASQCSKCPQPAPSPAALPLEDLPYRHPSPCPSWGWRAAHRGMGGPVALWGPGLCCSGTAASAPRRGSCWPKPIGRQRTRGREPRAAPPDACSQPGGGALPTCEGLPTFPGAGRPLRRPQPRSQTPCGAESTGPSRRLRKGCKSAGIIPEPEPPYIRGTGCHPGGSVALPPAPARTGGSLSPACAGAELFMDLEPRPGDARQPRIDSRRPARLVAPIHPGRGGMLSPHASSARHLSPRCLIYRQPGASTCTAGFLGSC